MAVGAVVPIPTLPAGEIVIRVASVLAVAPVTPAAAVWNDKLPEPPVPVPSDAAIVRLAPAMFVPVEFAPRMVTALGVAPSPTPKIVVAPATCRTDLGAVVPIPMLPEL